MFYLAHTALISVIPSLRMFLLFPALLRSGFAFWLALTLGCMMTIVLYLGDGSAGTAIRIAPLI